MDTPKKGARYIVLRAPEDLIQAAKSKARQQDRTLSQVVRELLRVWIAKQPQTAK